MIQITKRIALDESEVRFAFVRASGPGGQNVNKVATAVQVRFDVRRSPSLPEEVRERLIRLAGRRVTTEGILVLDARRFRTQERNRRDALERLVHWIQRAAQRPKRRRATQPTAASREKRHEEKKRRGEVKRLRSPVRLGIALWLAASALGVLGSLDAVRAIQPGEPPVGNRPGLSLQETCDLYLRAGQNGDLATLLSVLSDSSDFYFLAPTGELLDREGLRRFHEDWFRAEEWVISAERLSLREGIESGHALARLDYRLGTQPGDVQHLEAYLTLLFRREEGTWRAAAIACTPIRHYLTSATSGLEYGMDTLNVLQTIEQRRTVRRYRPDPVPDEHVTKILEAAGSAPTAGNQQPWKFLVVRDTEKIDHLKRQAVRWYLDAYRERTGAKDEEIDSLRVQLTARMEELLSAPVHVAVLVDTQAPYPEYLVEDGALAAGNLMVAARALGYGTGFFTSFFPEARMREFFEIPERYRLICFTPIGVPGEWPEMPPKKTPDETLVREKFE